MESQQEYPEPRPNKSRVLLWIALFLVLLGINGVLFYLNTQKKAENEVLATKVQVTDNKLQAQIKEYEDLKANYERQSHDLQKLGLSNDSLEARISTINADLLRLRSFKAGSFSVVDQQKFKLRALNLEGQLKKKDTQLADLRKDNQDLYNQGVTVKKQLVKLTDTISTLAKTTQELAAKVEVGSRLLADNIRITMLNKRDKELTDDKEEFKARKVDRVKVVFKLVRNDIAPKDTKSIYLRILEPDGAALYNLSTGGGTFTTDGQEAFYTMKKDFVFDNTNQPLEFVYPKGGAYKIGQHTVELYEGGALMGKATFTLK